LGTSFGRDGGARDYPADLTNSNVIVIEGSAARGKPEGRHGFKAAETKEGNK
jgi:hypothetical protein